MKWLQEKATAYTALTITQQVASTSAVLLLTNSQWPQVNYLNQWGGTEESGRKAEAENRKEQISRSGGGLSCVILSFLWARECSWKAPLSELKPLLSSLCFSFRQKLNSSAAEGRGLWSAFFFFFFPQLCDTDLREDNGRSEDPSLNMAALSLLVSLA